MEFNKVEVARFLLYGLILSCLVVSAVHAETLTGTLGGTTSASTNYVTGTVGGANRVVIGKLSVNDIENAQFTTALVREEYEVATFTAGSPMGNTTPFIGYVAGVPVCNGTIGYQRRFNSVGVEQPGYTWMTFNGAWNVSTLTGDKAVDLVFGNIDGWQIGMLQVLGINVPPTSGDMYIDSAGALGTTHPSGMYIRAQAETTSNSYSFTKPSGIGIAGYVSKATPSRVFISNGTTPFSVISSDATINLLQLNVTTPAESIIVSVQNTGGIWYNSSVLFSPAVAPSAYYITVVPDTISYTGAAIGTIVSGGGDLTKINDITWYWQDSDLTQHPFSTFGNASRPLDYTKSGATWYGYEPGGYTLNMGATMPNGVSLGNLTSTGVKVVGCFVGTSDGLWYPLSAPLTVSTTGIQTLTIQVKDASNGNLVTASSLAVKNVGTGTWTNISPTLGTHDFLFPYSTNLYIEANATGYDKTTLNYLVTNAATNTLMVALYPTTAIAVGNVTVNVLVNDAGNSLAPIPGALVHAYQMMAPGGESKLTSGAGIASFNLSETASYTIAVTKYGYQNGGASITTGIGGNTTSITITLQRATAPTPTVTVPTAVPSGVPTMVGGNYTGFWGPFYNMFGAMGANALTMQLLMACFFVFCGVVIGGFGMGTVIPGAPFSGTGAEAGGVFAFVLACAFGFISILWLIVIFVWIAFRYFLR